MINLRKLIRTIIVEALAKSHFKERIFDRLESEFTTFSKEKQQIKDIVYNDIEFLKKVNFPGQDNIGILLFKSPNNYLYQKEIDNKVERSAGNFVWVVIRANDLETIVFGDHQYIPRNTQIHLNINKLKAYIEQRKGMDFNLTDADLKYIQKWNPDIKNEPKDKPSNEVVLNINGIKYIFDKENRVLFKKNSPAEKSKIDDVFDSLPEKNQEEIMAYL
jgi:hypothetical protein